MGQHTSRAINEPVGPLAGHAPHGAIPYLIFLVFVIAIGATGYFTFQHQKQSIRQGSQDMLSAIADAKVSQIGDWLQQRYRHGATVAGDGMLAAEAERFFRGGAGQDAAQRNLSGLLAALREHYHYRSVTLLDAQANGRLSAGDPDELSAPERERAREAMRTGRFVLSDLHRQSEGGQGAPELDAAAPLAVRTGTGAARIVGAIHFRTDPHRHLYPLVQSWPTPSPSAETLLVRLDGDQMLFLNELRHQKGTALRLRLPIHQEQVAFPAIMAGRGLEGIFEGNDYRGVPVLAAVRQVPGTAWYAISKVDTSEIYGGIRTVGQMVAALVSIFILGAALGLIIWFRWQHDLFAMRERQGRLERKALAHSFDFWTRYANDTFFLTDGVGRIIDFNDRAVEYYGHPREKLLGMSVRALHRPEDSALFDSRFSQLLEQGSIRYEGVHRRADGSELWVEASVRAFEERGARFFQSIVRDIGGSKRVEHALKESEERFRDLAQISSDWSWEQDTQFRFINVSKTVPLHSGITARQHYGKTRWELPGTTPVNTDWEQHQAVLRAHRPFRNLLLKRETDGETHYISVSGKPLFDERGVFTGYRGVASDVTERINAENALKESQQRFRATFEQAAIGIAHASLDGTLILVNRTLCDLLGYGQDELVGRAIAGLMHPQYRSEGEEIGQTLLKGAVDKVSRQQRMLRRDEATVWVNNTASLVRDEAGQPKYSIWIVEDVTEHHEYETRLAHLATHDALTGLPNRNLLADRVSQAMVHARRDGRMLAVLFLDLDRFKLVNDSYGHSFGDTLLREVGVRLVRLLREGDTVARIGGDEFSIVLPGIRRIEDISHVASKLLNGLAQPWTIGERQIYVSGSIGGSVYPVDSEEVETLLKNADSAMYEAKSAGKNTFRFYSEDLGAQAQKTFELENDLRQALEREEFELHYQPQVDLKTGRVTSAEALIRWRHPRRGMVSPADFIPIAEDTGLIVPIGTRVIQAACRQAAQWQRLPGFPRVGVAVNLSLRQFWEGSIIETTKHALEESGLDPALLELEVTESVVMRNADATVGMLSELKSLGLRISIDDFGTGYSSLSYLRRLPVDTLKIDMSFVREIGTEEKATRVVAQIINLSHAFELRAIAEGVETQRQARTLEQMGCDGIQGYFLSRPLPADEFQDLIRSRDTWLD